VLITGYSEWHRRYLR